MSKRDAREINRNEVREELDERQKSFMRAEARSREIVIDQRMRPGDPLYFPPEKIPYGWTYLWVRTSTLGIPDLDNERFQLHRGWTPVPADRHPEESSKSLFRNDQGDNSNLFIRKGLLLCEMPTKNYREYLNLVNKATAESVRSLGNAVSAIPKDSQMVGRIIENHDDDPDPNQRIQMNEGMRMGGGRTFGY